MRTEGPWIRRVSWITYLNSLSDFKDSKVRGSLPSERLSSRSWVQILGFRARWKRTFPARIDDVSRPGTKTFRTWKRKAIGSLSCFAISLRRT
jgi:hypothetical protein